MLCNNKNQTIYENESKKCSNLKDMRVYSIRTNAIYVMQFGKYTIQTTL